MESGANISAQQKDKSTPVHLAASQGALNLLMLMFKKQPEERLIALSTEDAQGMMPIHYAAMFDYCEIVEYLVKQVNKNISCK